MKAVKINKFGGLNVLAYSDVDIPNLGNREVRVKVKAAGVNPCDTYVREGNWGGNLPLTLGFDAAGIVESVGTQVQSVNVGDRVFTIPAKNCVNTGTYAQYCNVSEFALLKLPDSLSFQQGASLGIPYFTAAFSLFQLGEAKTGTSVLVRGASGGVGTACVQLCKAHGFTVYGTAGSQRGMQLCTELGCARVFNHREAGHFEALQQACGNVDLIMEMRADLNLTQDSKLIREGGTIVVIGSLGKQPKVNTSGKKFNLRHVTVTQHGAADFARIWSDKLVAGVKNGWLAPVISSEFSLEEAAHAQELIMSQPNGASGNIVLTPPNFGDDQKSSAT